jgi:uncharacterized protein YdhG (YjbR/CyaY superfamily)
MSALFATRGEPANRSYQKGFPESAPMKKSKSSARASRTKDKDDAKGVDQYIDAVPEPARSTMKRVRAMIRSAAPREATEGLSYAIPAFKYKGPFFAYAAFSNHCSLFPMSGRIIEAFKDDLKNFQTSKGTIRFPVDKPPSASLIQKMVKARVALQERKESR